MAEGETCMVRLSARRVREELSSFCLENWGWNDFSLRFWKHRTAMEAKTPAEPREASSCIRRSDAWLLESLPHMMRKVPVVM